MLATLNSYATNYYVDPYGWGSNQGTLTNPWRSINDIPWYINYFKPGDTLFFKRDRWYTGTLSLNSSGSAGAPIVIMGYGDGNAPKFQYNIASPTEQNVYDRTVIRLNQANYIVIDGIELTDDYIPWWNHNVNANVGYGVYIYGTNGNGSHNVIKNVTISKLGCGVSIDGGNDNTITDCTILNLRMILNTPDVEWDDFGAMGIMIGGSYNTITRNIIQECYSNSYDYQIDGGAIEMYGAVSNNKIMYNKCSENLGFMEFGSSSGQQALNNVIGYNLLINNGHVFWINTNNGYGVDVRNLQFYNNNVIETHAPRLPDVRNLIGIASTPWIPNVLTMKNNIFWIATSSNVTDPNIQPFNGPQLIHQSNVYHLSGGLMGFNMDGSEKKLNQNDQVFANTSSSDPGQWDYALNVYGAAANIGQNIGIEKDFYDQVVPTIIGMIDAGIAQIMSAVRLSSTTLPVQFLSVKGLPGANGNTVTWETTNDITNHFEVEKSDDGIKFKKLANVPYNAKNGTTTTKYQYVDVNKGGDAQYYRIKAVTTGSDSSYSQTVSISNIAGSNKNSGTNILTIFPNPATDYVYLKSTANDLQNKDMVLVNMSGMELKRTRITDGNNQAKLDVSKLPRGVYVIKLMDNKTGKAESTMFTK
ncbi:MULTISPECIES: T9SS type A sorting domain-containing protein [Niastella]|uniref:T9SS type A sorting domain-containing protein n=1 Tax=Niastella soli TaxID=2821487 RepID=A0ABS3Z430_9BACT|nr:T9SS type A sorting domain-containing protein [Niastella soli]MBO9204922.1 T9SS type A sorting domain-containing protein [Niastella soli]